MKNKLLLLNIMIFSITIGSLVYSSEHQVHQWGRKDKLYRIAHDENIRPILYR